MTGAELHRTWSHRSRRSLKTTVKHGNFILKVIGAAMGWGQLLKTEIA